MTGGTTTTFVSGRWPGLVVKVGSRVLTFDGNKLEAGPDDVVLVRAWMKQHPNSGVTEIRPGAEATTATAPAGPSMANTRAELAAIAEDHGVEPGRLTKAQLLEAIEEAKAAAAAADAAVATLVAAPETAGGDAEAADGE